MKILSFIGKIFGNPNYNPTSCSVCPYCKTILDKKPTRNKKCPNCQKRIMIRKKALMTEKQADEYDQNEIQKIRKEFKKSLHNSLINYKKSGIIKYIEISAAKENSCDACRALNGKKFSLEEALKKPPLPVKNCTGIMGYCRCCYLPVVDYGGPQK